MGEFGRRTGGPRADGFRQFESGHQRQPEQDLSDLISKSDLKVLEKGQLPTWTSISRLQLVGIALFVIAMVMGALGYYGPGVVRDLRHAGTFKVAYDLRATDGNCTRYAFLVTLCSVKIQSLGNARFSTTTPYLMFFRSGDGERLVPVRSTADASAIGIQYAVSDILLNRTLSLLGFIIFFGWISWIFVQCLREGRYQGGRAHLAVLQHVAMRSQPA